MEGTIKKIILQDFVTYDAVECIPCENLNIIIGPNGTGKSTIVSAIMLGLGEKPNSTGRGKKVQEFIKTGCREARIILQLHPDHTVERRIMADGKSAYKLNGQTATDRDITAFTKQLNIQVGNLCQFLPQDRVSEFARMNKKELLINTEKAVGGEELVNLHNELIHMQANNQNQGGDLEKMESSLASKREQNARLDVDVTTITEKNNLLLEISNCKKLLLWLQYEVARAEQVKAKRECSPKEDAVKEAKNAVEPLRRQKIQLELKHQEIKEKRRSSAKSCDMLEAKLRSKLEEVHDAFSEIKSLENSDKRNAAKEGARMEKIQSLQQSIEDQDQAISEMEAALTEKKRQMSAINKVLEEYGQQITKLEDQIRQIRAEASQYRHEERDLQSKINAVENVTAQKLDLLRRVDQDAYRGVQWVEANRHLFSATVYLPLMVELNVNDHRCARYLENAIGFRDLVAFACENADDTNLLINELRMKQNLSVSVLTTDVNRNISPQPMSNEDIRRLGFDGFLDQYLDGPEPLKRYLKASSGIHRSPVSHREVNIDVQLPSSISRFYTDGKVVVMSGSRYSSDKITQVSTVRNASCLAISQNVSDVDAERSRLHVVQDKLQSSNVQVSALTGERDKLNEMCAQKRDERKSIQQADVDVKSANYARNRFKLQLDALQQEQEAFVAGRNNLQEEVQELIKKAVTKQVASVAIFQNVRKVLHDVRMAKIEESVEKLKWSNIEKSYKALQRKQHEAEEELERARTNNKSLLDRAKKIFEEARRETEGFVPNDEAFKKYDTIFKMFPQEIPELEELIDQKTALVACKRNVNESVLTEYQARAREIEQLEKSIRKKEEEITNFKMSMSRKREAWLHSLKVLVNKISRNFSKYYKEIQCAGDVVLEPGSDEHDYKSYGLSIKVSYRESAPLKELDQFTQSGGERAVATALYMISLQELTKVPFRCVDEINQGMDETNERRVYKLLMSITSSENTSQYFLLTPKLLKGIDYSAKCMVHCVFNGPHVLPYKSWNIDSFISRKRRRLDSD